MVSRVRANRPLSSLMNTPMRFLASVFCAALGITPLRAKTPTNQYPYQNPNLPLEERVNNLVSLMTLQEKVAYLTQSPAALPRLGLPRVNWVEGLHGLGQ